MSFIPKLTDAQVATIRTVHMTDSYYADLWDMDRTAIFNARVGNTHKRNRTPPDTAPRTGGKFRVLVARRRAPAEARVEA